MYTDDKNIQIVLALLKEYGIKKVVVSPGMKNVPVALSVQQDSYFEVYSVVDERGAAYFATGLAFESGEPVVITCTGATASRNYLPGLTESFYRKLPIIALTCGHQHAEPYTLTPQQPDRMVSQNDIKLLSVFLPIIHEETEYNQSVFLVNKALTTSLVNGGGPVHINVLTDDTHSFSTKELPMLKKINYFGYDELQSDSFEGLTKKLKGKKIGVFIGSHKKFSDELTNALENFASAYNVAVFCDHTSCYQGKNRIQIKQGMNIKDKADIIVDIGGISGSYADFALFSAEVWRISEDGAFIHRGRQGVLTHIFNCSECFFFSRFSENDIGKSDNSFFDTAYSQLGIINIPALPLSNTFISQKLSELLPKDSSLHLGILNSLRNMNLFNLNKGIDSSCNVGGFGIDGAVSTLIGQSMVNKNRLYFGLIGDLAFFYDMNGLGIRHIDKNIRLLVVNNNQGVEFRLNPNIEPFFKEAIDPFTAARGHFGSAKGWVESMGFHYMTASIKEEFLSLIGEFCNADINYFDKPVLFEVFTKVEDEQDGLKLITEANLNTGTRMLKAAQSIAQKVLPAEAYKSVKNKAKEIIRK